MDIKENHSPKELRLLCREQKFAKPTAGYCKGYVQANIVIIPANYAEDFKQFCELNPKPCPLLEMTEVGSWECHKFCPEGLDLRTDVPKYKVFRHGKFEEERLDITDLW